MKRLLKKYMLCLSAIGILSVSAACSNEDDSATSTTSQTREALQLTVSAGDFVTDGAPATRAADNGNVTTFESGDRIGLIIVKENGKDIVANNVPYKYNGTSWAFDADNGDTKSVVYYDNGIGNVTYIAYFPYSKEADGVKKVEDLKDKFIPKTDQSSKADYRASDLMVWTKTADAPKKSLEIDLTHAYNSVSLSLEDIKYTLDDGKNTSGSAPLSYLSEINLNVGSDICIPFKAEDGSFRCILPESTGGTIRCFYTLWNKIYVGELALSGGISGNTRYVKQETIYVTYSLDNAQMGDFYCKKENGKSYLIPNFIASLTSEQKADCLGIVLKAGKDKDGDWKDDCVYKQKDGTTDMPTINGYVLALYDAYGGNTCQWSSVFNMINLNGERYTGFYGYKNTQAIKSFNTDQNGTLQEAFPAAYYASVDYDSRENNKYAAPANSSGWFLPSAGQCYYWRNNKSFMLDQVRKATGNSSYSWQKTYWSSSEVIGNQYSYVYTFILENVSISNQGKKGICSVRPFLAF